VKRLPLPRVRPVALVLAAVLAASVGGLAVASPAPYRAAGAATPPAALLAAQEHGALATGQQAQQVRQTRLAQQVRQRALAPRARAAQAARPAAVPAAAPPVIHLAVRRAARVAPVLVVRARPAPAHQLETPAQRGARVLASLHYPWQALGYSVVFLPGRDGYLGLTDAQAKRVTIWVRGTESDVVLAHTIAHELGHVLDFTHGISTRRALYLSLRGLAPGSEWFGCPGGTDFQTPAGDWAEVFAYWLAGPGDFRSTVGPVPTPAQLAALRSLFVLS
jgi:hypothetical protein